MDASTIWAAVGSLATVATAIIATVAASQSRHSSAQANEAAASASRATEVLTAIEGGRRHDELTPEFELELTPRGQGTAELRVTFSGGRLVELDQVTLTILDETGTDHWAHGLPQGVTQEEAEAFVWGPWQFNTGASAQVISNRQTRPRAYSRVSGKTWDRLALERTRPGHWMTGTSQEQWQGQHDDLLRIQIIAVKDGYDPWIEIREVSNPPRPRIRTLE